MKFIKRNILGVIVGAAIAVATAFARSAHSKLFNLMVRNGLVLQAAHTGVAAITDTTYAISATLPATYDAAGYGDTDTVYTTIGKVSTMTPYGSKRDVNKFQPIAGTVEKTKGSPDYGQGDMVMADVPADAGQVIMKAAEASPNHYSLKITYADGEVHYLDILVSGWVLSGGSEGDPLLRTATIDVCRAPVVVAAT